MSNSDTGRVADPAVGVSEAISQDIRNLHTSASRDLERAASEILEKVEALRVNGVISSDTARQLAFDVRNERSRINR